MEHGVDADVFEVLHGPVEGLLLRGHGLKGRVVLTLVLLALSEASGAGCAPGGLPTAALLPASLAVCAVHSGGGVLE